MSPHLPVYYISHAGPNLAVDNDSTSKFLGKFGKYIKDTLKPKAIVIFSAHWEENEILVSTASKTSLIYDFYGFPEEYYKLQYPVMGSPEVANRVIELLHENGIQASGVTSRGLDHGVWVPLLRALPDADIPVVQVSLGWSRGATSQPTAQAMFARHIQIGKALQPLRDEEVLIIGSGSSVHNLREMMMYAYQNKVPAYTKEFDGELTRICCQTEGEERIREFTETLSRDRNLFKAHPTIEHLIPVHVAVGAADGEPGGKCIHRGEHFGSTSTSAFGWGESALGF